jgi:hypothetical protein
MSMASETKTLKQESKVVNESWVSRIKFTPLVIITAILLLMSILVNIKSYSIEVNESVKISRQILEIIDNIPQGNIVIRILIVIIIIYLLYGMFKKGISGIIGYVISLMIIDIGIELTMSDLMLENVTNLYIIKVNHCIPIETRVEYLSREMIECYKQTTVLNKTIESKLTDIATTIERSVDMLRLNEMTAKDITYYARELLTNAVRANDLQHSNKVYDATMQATGYTTIISVSYVVLVTLFAIGGQLIENILAWYIL